MVNNWTNHWDWDPITVRCPQCGTAIVYELTEGHVLWHQQTNTALTGVLL